MTYLLFLGYAFYPDGGADEFVGSFSSVDAAKKRAEHEIDDWYDMWAHIAVLENGKMRIIWRIGNHGRDVRPGIDHSQWREEKGGNA